MFASPSEVPSNSSALTQFHGQGTPLICAYQEPLSRDPSQYVVDAVDRFAGPSSASSTSQPLLLLFSSPHQVIVPFMVSLCHILNALQGTSC